MWLSKHNNLIVLQAPAELIEVEAVLGKKRPFCALVLVNILTMFVIPLGVVYYPSVYSLKQGLFVDKIVFEVITAEDAQILALLDGDIDLVGQYIHPEKIPQLQQAENIGILQSNRPGFGQFYIKTDKYPFNITEFRRAFAFALDKNRICEEVWNGYATPQDTILPLDSQFSIEGQLPFNYTLQNLTYANQLLDDAGFIDIDDDGFREAPDGSAFNVTITHTEQDEYSFGIVAIANESLNAIGVKTWSVASTFYEWIHRIYCHLDYDIIYLHSFSDSIDIYQLGYEFHSENQYLYGRNLPNFNNATFDDWCDLLLNATSIAEVESAFSMIQEILTYQCPVIPVCEPILLVAYRTDRFEGFVNDSVKGALGWWTNYKVHLLDTLDGPFGGTLRRSIPLDVDTFNFMVSSSRYTHSVTEMLYDSLLILDPDGNDMLWLAESLLTETHQDNTEVPDGNTRFTFEILDNITWSDGTPMTAEDIAFTLNYYRDAPGNPYGHDLDDLVTADAQDNDTVIFEFASESFWNLHIIGFKPILPKHVFEDIGSDNWNLWNPEPPEDAMITSGPFIVWDYVPGEFIDLLYNPNYFHGIDIGIAVPDTTIDISYVTISIIIGAIAASAIVIAGGLWKLKRK